MTVKSIGVIIISLVILLSCVKKPPVDEYGNPIFNSIPIGDTTVGEFGVAANYYTIGNNIANTNSSVFISKKPSNDQVWKFIQDKPSYFFIIHVDRDMKRIAGLFPDGDHWKDAKWKWEITLPGEEGIELPSKLKGPISEHRILELKGGLFDKSYKYLDPKSAMFQAYQGRVYKILPYSAVLEEIISITKEKKLYR